MFEDFIRAGIIEPAALHTLLSSAQSGNIRVVDATFVLGGAQSPHQTYLDKRIENALFFDIEGVSHHASPLPHMLPSAPEFEVAISAMGISNDDLVVLYGQSGMTMGPARAWWTFRVFGHERVCVLNGGLPAWIAEGFPVHSGPVPVSVPSRFSAVYNAELVKLRAQVEVASDNSTSMILDARAAARFAGNAPEPRPGMRSGHIPGSCNVPANALISPETGKILPRTALQSLFAETGLSPEKPVIASCGSGVTACVIALALHNIGHELVAVYDGSWAEWGQEGSNTKVSVL